MNTPEKPLVSFGIVADLQYCDAPPFKNRCYQNSIQKLEKAIESLNHQELDFVVNLGDIIDRDWQSFDKILPYFDKFNAPVHHVLGNHDYEVENDKKAQVHERIGCKRYDHFHVKNWRFIILDGNEISTFANLPESENYTRAEKLLEQLELEEKANANFWNGGIGQEQIDWLESVLNNATEKEELIIVFCHYPIFPPDKHNLLSTEDILTLLKNYKGVKMWINGHNHKGNYGLFEGIHFVNVRGMVEGEYDVAWSIVDLYENEIMINGFGNEISARLTI